MMKIISKVKMNRKNKKRKGFTLVELVIVVAIIGIIAAIAIPQFASMTLKSKASALEGTHNSIVSAVNLFASEHGELPKTVGELNGYLEGVEPNDGNLEKFNNKPEDANYLYVFNDNTITITSTLTGAVSAGLDVDSRVGKDDKSGNYVIKSVLTNKTAPVKQKPKP